MKKIPSSIYNYLSSITKIQFFSNTIIIEANKKKYICKEPMKKEVIEYLESIKYRSYFKKINIDQEYDLCEINQVEDEICLFELFKKSKEIKKYDDEELQRIYYKMEKLYEMRFNNYFHIQDLIEEQLYPTHINYNLLIHFSHIYRLLSLGNYFLEEWHNRNKTEYTSILWVEDISKNNILYNKILEIPFLKRDNIVFELANYYQEYYQNITIINDMEEIIRECNIKEEEKYLYYSLISIPPFKSQMSIDAEKTLEYVMKTTPYLLKKYKENQKTKEDMLKQQQKDIKLSSNEN